ncbi:Meiotic Sister-Chromatid recombination aldehyde dehydrogenase [Scheffersomyces spartinae]|uniref:Meiotic Sister-Chromatid recombination aldehyde dehydrogenase n=1 Tax=Scheffersomyces spartinae TaxID=45513 RepID=A0A9P8AHP8_9ASCO|nr:Meiotic Sister-Chromatid recombination aldehyde dehydrogenase [Scheffersomyces spartinae]KAG7192747.1 Meiotic Sister-Chromatid recombination aldehyde dehydrogenase [Scheffersomyces spartinae]
MILININLNGWQSKYQILTLVVALLVPLIYYLYARYVTSRPNRYNGAEEPIKFHVAVPEAAAPHWKGRRLNPPSIRLADDPSSIQSYCPATGQYLGTFMAHTPYDIDDKIDRARRAQKGYQTTSFMVRRKLLKTLARYIGDHQEDFARVACRDSGKTRVDALMGEILVTLEKLNWIISNGEKALKPSQRPGPAHRLIGILKQAEVRYEPLGVVAAIVSWNYPFHNLMGPVIASLFTGNAVIIKCSEQVVWSSVWFLKVIHAALKLCGLNEDLVQLCYCFPDTADHFTLHPGLDHITFIGSKAVAHKVVASAAKQLTPCVVELGGKDAVIVLDDVTDTIQSLASVIMRGTFQSAGQNCIGIERVICLPKNYDHLVSILESRIKDLRLGSDIDQLDEIDVGAMISDNRFSQLGDLIEDALDKGATLLHGGKQYHHPNYPQGHYFEPTLLVDVTKDMRIFNEEVFGPICTIVRSRDVDEAIELANSTEYGLGGSVFSNDFNAANDVANRLKTGNVAINDFATFYVCQLPFGGIKKSGYGKFGGEEGLRGLCIEKSVVMDKSLFRALGVATSIPPQIDYPIKNDTKAWTFVSSLNKAGYDTRTWEIVKALKKLGK